MSKKYLNMFTSPLIKKAIYFAAEKHDGQYRRGTRVPYFAHPTLVAMGVIEFSTNPETVAAAVLHDVLEDCDVTTKELTKLFGKRITKIVNEVSSPAIHLQKHQTWINKKRAYIKKIKKASQDALIIIAVDKINNMQAYFGAMMSSKIKNVDKLFGGSLLEYLWYYEEILDILQSRLSNHPATATYKKIFRSYQILFKV